MRITLLYSFILLLSLDVIAGGKQKQATSVSNESRLYFTENKGQVGDQHFQPRPDVLFTGQMKGLSFHLCKDGISYQQYRVERWEVSVDERQVPGKTDSIPAELSVYRTDIRWLNSKPEFEVEKGRARPGHENYYLPVCPEGVSGVQSFEAITYRNIYDGIDVKWYDREGSLEYDFVVAPGADYRQIRWEIEGAEEVTISENGELLIRTPFGEIREQAPVALQDGKEIEVKWDVTGKQVGFRLEEYDRSRRLVIDPWVRAWGTYFGGITDDKAWGSAIDIYGDVYLSGETGSMDYIATTGAYQATLSGIYDAFLVKFNGDGARQWATYYGGTDRERGTICSVDSALNVYMAGASWSPDVIATPGCHQDTLAGVWDIFIVRFDRTGKRLWGTYYGGEDKDDPTSCGVDPHANIYLAGRTLSKTGISSAGSHQPLPGSLPGDELGYITKFDKNGVRQWGTYYQGVPKSCVVNDTMGIFAAGWTMSDSGVSTPGVHQAGYGGGFADGFFVKFNGNGVREWGSYYGGLEQDNIDAITIDVHSNIYIAGSTNSEDAIATTNSMRPTKDEYYDTFFAKFDRNGIRIWGTYYGGETHDWCKGIAVNDFGDVCVSGHTRSRDHISGSSAFQRQYNDQGDVYLIVCDSSGKRLRMGTYYGGTAEDYPVGNPLVSGNNLYLAGYTASGGLASAGSYQQGNKGSSDAFLVNFRTTVGFDEMESEEDYYVTYPNPSNGTVYIRAKNMLAGIKVKLYDIIGHEVISYNHQNTDLISLHIPGPAGLYFLKITAGDKTVVKQLVKQ